MRELWMSIAIMDFGVLYYTYIPVEAVVLPDL